MKDNMPALTIPEAAELAHCSYHTIHRAIKNGDLAAYKPGKTVLILQKDFNLWFESKKIHAVKLGRPRRTVTIQAR